MLTFAMRSRAAGHGLGAAPCSSPSECIAQFQNQYNRIAQARGWPAIQPTGTIDAATLAAIDRLTSVGLIDQGSAPGSSRGASAGDTRSPTSTSTEVRSPTSTSTDAYTSGNITVTGGAGAGAYTVVNVYRRNPYWGQSRVDADQYMVRSEGAAKRTADMIREVMAPRAPSPMPAIMASTMGPRAPLPATMQSVYGPRAPHPFTAQGDGRGFGLATKLAIAGGAATLLMLLNRKWG